MAAAGREARSGLHRALHLLARTLVSIEGTGGPVSEEQALLQGVVDALAVCHALVEWLDALER